MAYEFHYTPTGTGVISGKEVLEQTEDAINDLGNTAISGVQEALDKAEQALTNSANAVDDAQTALNTANNAEGVAIQAQTDVGNLSGTVTNIGNRVTTAEGNISNLQGRMTTAEGNITNLQGRMTTAETNIGNLQTAVSTAQATANSAQQTATTARQQSYVFRYSSTALVASSTNSNTLLDNTDNLKVGDKVIDSDGVLFSITAIDTVNSTFTVGSALIDLALDGNVVHTSGNETVGGQKTFANNRIIVGRNTDSNSAIQLVNSDVVGDSAKGSSGFEVYGSSVSTDNKIGGVTVGEYSNNGGSYAKIECNRTVSDVKTSNTVRNLIRNDGSKEFSAGIDNDCKLGHPYFRWSEVYATNYYYGSNNVEFSTKFVTTDTAQTISGAKTFSSNTIIYNSDSTANTPNLILQSSKIQLGDTSNSDSQGLIFNAGSSFVSKVDSFKDGSGTQNLQNHVRTKDASNNVITAMYRLRLFNSGLAFLESSGDNTISLGRNNAKWKDCQTYLVNGLTPSSLGMPSDTYVDISGYITDFSGGYNQYTAPDNGIVAVDISGTNSYVLYNNTLSIGDRQTGSNFRRAAIIQVRKNDSIIIQSNGGTLNYAKFYPCQGNI